ncbi:MAG: MBL fold metallo-hydrolase [Chloroflexota bacterium]
MHPLATLDVPANSVAIHWFEQSCYAIKDMHGTIIQIDPYFPHNRPTDRYIYPEPPLDESQLPTDYVLLTHDHGDHTCPESLERIWQSFPNAKFVGPAESAARIANETSIDASHVTTINAGDTITLGTMSAHVVYAKPPAGDPDANIPPPDVTHLGYVLKAEGVTLYFSGDPINTFAEHDTLTQAVAAHEPDVGFLTNHPTEGEFPFFDGCVKMAQGIGLKHAVPAHYECFVKRTYDPQEWVAQFPTSEHDPKTMVMPRNTTILYPA